MKRPASIQLSPGQSRRGEVPTPSVLDQFLPPDPAAPERPTIPPPSCGTLPPQLPSLLGLLGGLGRIGR
jgi:hypothetical protein